MIILKQEYLEAANLLNIKNESERPRLEIQQDRHSTAFGIG